MSRLEGQHGPAGSSGPSCGSSIKSFLLAAKSNTAKKVLSPKTGLQDSPEKHVLSNTGIRDRVDSTTGSSKLQDEKTGKSHSQTLQTESRLKTGQHMSAADEEIPSVSKTGLTGRGSIDREVLMALPEDIRDQVIAEYQQEGYIIPLVDDGVSKDEVPMDDEPKPSTSGYIGLPRKQQNQKSASESSHLLVSRNHRKNISRDNISMLSEGGHSEDFRTECETDKERVRGTMQKVNGESHSRSSEIIAPRQMTPEVTVNGDSSSSFPSEDVQNEVLITSFSQVGLHFL